MSGRAYGRSFGNRERTKRVGGFFHVAETLSGVIDTSPVEVKASPERVKVLKNGLVFDEKRYEFDDKFVPWMRERDGNEVHTIPELHSLMEQDKSITVEGTALAIHNRKFSRMKLDRNTFMEAIKKNEGVSFRESIVDTAFLTDADQTGTSSGLLVGQDFVPLLGGPFNKQLYIYDYLRMHSYAFFAVNHWPVAHAAVNIMTDFTLGRGYRIDVQDMKGNPHPKASALWDAFEEANDLQMLMHNAARELSVYGETMVWWLPDNETKIAYQLRPGQEPGKGLLPRVRLIDPSCIWDICTYPEDITRVLYYQWVAPTQYQTYTAPSVPSTKFIMQQIPADQVDHFKVNCMSNEKRGRSDLFSALGYIKRLSDSVNYSIIGLQKASAWSIDTTIEGNQNDLNVYAQEQASLGTIPQAGSEFIHTSKVKREYLGNQASSRSGSPAAFDWCFSQAAMALGIPVSYFGTHLSGGQTRASALVATEPVAKRFEIRQWQYERILQKMAKRLFAMFGIDDAQIEVTMPELLVQDRSAKLKDLALAEAQGWLSKDHAATIASKEFQISKFDYELEKQEIDTQGPPPGEMSPLTAPGEPAPEGQDTGITSQFRKNIADAG
jgi:hypothetical protein